MKREKWEEQIKWGLTAFLVLAAAVAVYLLSTNLKTIQAGLSTLLMILRPIIYGAVMAYLMAPVYDWAAGAVRKRLSLLSSAERAQTGKPSDKGIAERLRKRADRMEGIARLTGTLAALLLLITVSTGLVSMVIPELLKSVTNLINTFPSTAGNFYDSASQALSGYPEVQTTLENLYEELYSFVSGFMSNTLLPNIRNIVGSLSSGILSMVKWLMNLLLGLIVMVYLLNMKEKLVGQFRKLLFAFFPQHMAEAVVSELKYIDRMFGGFIVGKIVDSVIIGFLTFFVLSVMKMPYVMLVSVVVGATNVIPFFGPFIGAIPSFVLIFLASPMQGLYFLIVILVIQQLDGNVIGPKILGNSTGVSSFWVLFSILLFGGLFGFVGMIIAVPTWAVLMNLLRRYVNRRLREKRLPEDAAAYQEL
ncbi:AI-2E family transporter [Oribacterium sp. oral taxon 102]|uniref:AI-2E family transporter n=1 Tax=Oribacterium sp. oral taxon 102 TaxID=671214 RepID=UPI0015BAE0C9|nr:AI-2E family transporter [Oribacterium sp. oral taxon 102]NWO21174.1 AI-2E family transporter [Oribacterium sp. oral taxon 102]